MRVRLCWNRDVNSLKKKKKRSKYSAAQLLAKINGGDWIGSIEAKLQRERERGVTHLLLVQREGRVIVYAALIPLQAVVPIWVKQRDISDKLVAEGKAKKRKKNHAMNGSSPTLWLQDDRGGGDGVADALWQYPGVVDLTGLPEVGSAVVLPGEIAQPKQFTEGAASQRWVNAYERNTKARDECVSVYGTTCVICGFDFGKRYGSEFAGFIHVHHLVPLSEVKKEYQVNPETDLIPVCPNCHAVIHHGGQLRSPDEVKELLRRATNSEGS